MILQESDESESKSLLTWTLGKLYLCVINNIECSFIMSIMKALIVYSNKKETSDFHGTVSFDPVKML